MCKKDVAEGLNDGHTDGRTDESTDQLTDTPTSRVPSSRLKGIHEGGQVSK